jgi:recombination protein RecA
MTDQTMTEEEQLDALLGEMAADGLRTTDDFTVSWAPTGIASLDQSLGDAAGGGFPRQRISILQGEEHSGKTLISLAAIANCQRNNGRAAFIDAEHALTPDFARLLGVDFEALVVDRPKTLGQAYDILRKYGRSGLFDIIVWDSVTALVPESELDAPAADSQQRAAIPQMHSKELPKILATLHKRTAAILLNQMRTNPNPPAWHRGGTLLYAPGGKALRHASSMTISVKPGQVHKHGEQRVGQRIRTEAIKNKVAVPFRKAEFDLMYNTGIDLLTSLLDTAIELEAVRKKSSFFYMDIVNFETGESEEKRFAGRANIEQFLRDNPSALDNLQKQLAARDGDEA